MKQALILAGGRGSRLGGILGDIPKPLAPIFNNKAFLDLLINQISNAGFKELILLAGHHGDKVFDRYNNKIINNLCVKVIVETTPKGTAGALINCKDLLHEEFLLMNGDSFFDISIIRLIDEYMSKEFDVFIALREIENTDRYGLVELEKFKIKKFQEKIIKTESLGVVNGGIYLCKKNILQLISQTPSSLEQDLFPKLASEGRIGGLIYDGYFIDIGLPETLFLGCQELPKYFS